MNQPNPAPRSRVPRWAYLLSRTVAWSAILAGVGWLGVFLCAILWLLVGPTPDEQSPLGALAMVAGLSAPCAPVAVAFGLVGDRLARRHLRG